MGTERRSGRRYRCDIGVAFTAAATGDRCFWLGRVREVSADGLGIWLPSRLKPSGRLTVPLPGLLPVQARVVHSTPHGCGWLLGCELAERLREEEVRALLDGAGRNGNSHVREAPPAEPRP